MTLSDLKEAARLHDNLEDLVAEREVLAATKRLKVVGLAEAGDYPGSYSSSAFSDKEDPSLFHYLKDRILSRMDANIESIKAQLVAIGIDLGE